MEEDSGAYPGNIGLDNLPAEVLTIIMGYLPLCDRKNARRVDKRLYDACNELSILATEKLYCSWIDELPDILKTLMNSQRRILNLHFHGLTFLNYPKLFWEVCGSKIMSLDLDNCRVDNETVEMMLTQCSRLEHLRLYSSFDELDEHLFSPNNVLDRIIENGIINKNLNALVIDVICMINWLSNYTLLKLFTVFPNIKKLAFAICADELPSFDVCDLSETELQARDRLTFSSILNIISSQASVLESIKLPRPSHTSDAKSRTFMFDRIATVPDLTKLREIDLTIDGRTASRERVVDFFSKLEALESVRLDMEGKSDEFARDLVWILLEYCPRLRYLEFLIRRGDYFSGEEDSILRIDYRLFEKIATCSLISFILHAPKIIFDPKIIENQDLLVNQKLRCFEYYVIHCEARDDFDVAALKMFPNLKRRRIGETDPFEDPVGKKIFPVGKYVEKLRSLELGDFVFQPKTDNQDLGRAGLRILPELERSNLPNHELECVGFDVALNADNVQVQLPEETQSLDTKKSICYFPVLKDLECLDFTIELGKEILIGLVQCNLPALKYLKVSVSNKDSAEDVVTMLLAVAKNNPNLEALHFTYYDQHIPYDVWMTSCASLNKLQFLEIHDNFSEVCFAERKHLNDEDKCVCRSMYEDFFNNCPSLLALKHRAPRFMKFYRDVIKSRIQKMEPHVYDREYRVPASVGWAIF